MPGSTKKDLYIAKSIHELNKLASDIPQINNARLYATTAQKVYRGAEEAFMLADEERSYVLYMKYFNVITAIKKSADYKKQSKFFDELIGKKNCMNAISRAEELSASLKTRYEEAEALEISKKLDKLDSKEEPDVADEQGIKGNLTEDKKREGNGDTSKDATKTSKDVAKTQEYLGIATKSGGIDVQTIYRLLKDSGVSLVLMDTRSAEDFEKSHILSDKSISVPEDAVPPGCTVLQIEKRLPESSLKVWKTRGHVDYVVLFDWRCSSTTLNRRSTLMYLKDALFKWDQETILRAEPMILEGGYEEWLMCYPSLTTNSTVKCPLPPVNGATSDLPTLDSIDYDVELEFLQSPPSSPTESLPIPEDTVTATVLPPRTVFPLVDRSTKPKLTNVLNNATDVARSSTIKDIGNSRIVNKIDGSDVTQQPMVDGKINGFPTKAKVSEKNTNVTKLPVTTEIAGSQVIIPAVDRSKKPPIGQPRPIARQFSSSSSDEEGGGKVLRGERSEHGVHESKPGVQKGFINAGSLEEAELKNIIEIRKVKDREVKSLAEIMRKKKKIEEELKKKDQQVSATIHYKKDDSLDRRIKKDDYDSISSIEDDVDSSVTREVLSDGSDSGDSAQAKAGSSEANTKRNDEKLLLRTSKEIDQKKDNEEGIKEKEQSKVELKNVEPERIIAKESKTTEEKELKTEEEQNKEHEAEKKRELEQKKAEKQRHLEKEAEKERQLQRDVEKRRQLELEAEKQRQLELEATAAAAAKREQEAARLKQQQLEAAKREQTEKERKEQERLAHEAEAKKKKVPTATLR